MELITAINEIYFVISHDTDIPLAQRVLLRNLIHSTNQSINTLFNVRRGDCVCLRWERVFVRRLCCPVASDHILRLCGLLWEGFACARCYHFTGNRSWLCRLISVATSNSFPLTFLTKFFLLSIPHNRTFPPTPFPLSL